eukprot:10555974-Ditylum_brightwellii.AAC.1
MPILTICVKRFGVQRPLLHTAVVLKRDTDEDLRSIIWKSCKAKGIKYLDVKIDDVIMHCSTSVINILDEPAYDLTQVTVGNTRMEITVMMYPPSTVPLKSCTNQPQKELNSYLMSLNTTSMKMMKSKFSTTEVKSFIDRYSQAPNEEVYLKNHTKKPIILKQIEAVIVDVMSKKTLGYIHRKGDSNTTTVMAEESTARKALFMT